MGYIYIAHQHDAQGDGAEEDHVLEVRSELDLVRVRLKVRARARARASGEG